MAVVGVDGDLSEDLPAVGHSRAEAVAAGLVDSISHPGGNITGVSSLGVELTPKRLEILLAV